MPYLLIYLLFILLGNSAHGRTFEDYVFSLQYHPQVTSIIEEGQKYEDISLGEMGLPDPQIIIGVDNIPIESPVFDRFLPSSKVLGIQQHIPSYGLRKAKAKKQKAVVTKQNLIADYMERRLEAYLIIALVRLEEISNIGDSLNQKLNYYVELENHLMGKLEAGQSSYGEFSEIDIERIDVETQINELKAERVKIESELVRLVGEVPAVKIPGAQLQQEVENVSDSYPILIAMQDICIAHDGITIANKAYSPNYSVKALYKQRESGDNFSGDDWFSVQATISFPLWSRWNQAPKLRAARAEKRSAEFSTEDLRREWIKKFKVLVSERDVALENVNLLVKKKIAISEVISSAERDYEAGKTGLESILNARIDGLTVDINFLKQKSRHIRLSAEYNSHFIRKGTI